MQNQHQIQRIIRPSSRLAWKQLFIPLVPDHLNGYSPSFSTNRAIVHLSFFSKCSVNWLPNHRDNCVTKGKTSKSCGLLKHFANISHKWNNQNRQNPKKRSVNTVDEDPHPEDTVNFLHSSKLFEFDYSSGKDNMVATIQNDFAEIEPLNMPIRIENISTSLLVDFGSACSILNQSLASRVVNSSSYAFWVRQKANPKLKNFSNKSIRIEDKIQTPLLSNGWNTRSATFTVVADGLKSLFDRYLFYHLGLSVTHATSSSINQVIQFYNTWNSENS